MAIYAIWRRHIYEIAIVIEQLQDNKIAKMIQDFARHTKALIKDWRLNLKSNLIARPQAYLNPYQV